MLCTELCQSPMTRHCMPRLSATTGRPATSDEEEIAETHDSLIATPPLSESFPLSLLARLGAYAPAIAGCGCPPNPPCPPTPGPLI